MRSYIILNSSRGDSGIKRSSKHCYLKCKICKKRTQDKKTSHVEVDIKVLALSMADVASDKTLTDVVLSVASTCNSCVKIMEHFKTLHVLWPKLGRFLLIKREKCTRQLPLGARPAD